MKSKLFSLLYLFILGFLFISCEESNSIEYESDDILKKNNITDVVDLFCSQQHVDDNTMYLYTGIRKQHEWFALFDASTGMLLKEWYGRERNYIKRGIYHGGSDFFFKKVNDTEFVFSNHYINENYEWTRQLISLKNDDVYYGSKVNDYAILEYLVPDRFMNHDYSTSYCYIQDFKGNIIADSLTLGFEYDNKTWYIGFYDDHARLLVHENDTLQEYMFNEDIEWNRSIHLGYGKYETYRIESFNCIKRIEKTNLGYVIIPAYNTDNEELNTIVEDAFILGDNTHKFIRLDKCNSDISEIQKVDNVWPWFNGSILLYKKYVISPNLEIIAEGSYSKYGNFFSDFYVPVSYSDWVVIDMSSTWGHMERYNNKEELLWELSLDLLDKYKDGFHEPQYTFRLENKNGNLYTFTCDILTYDGNRYKETFTVNVDTGELI